MCWPSSLREYSCRISSMIAAGSIAVGELASRTNPKACCAHLPQFYTAADFFSGQDEILIGMARVMPRKIKQVGDGLQWIIDLVRNGSGETSGSSQFFAAADGFFGLFLGGDITRYR